MNRWLPAAVAMLALAAPAPPPSPTPTVEDARPEIAIPAGPLTVEQQIMVTLRHWPPAAVQLVVCGNEGRRKALDCASDRAAQVQVPAGGTAVASVRLAAPPVACPCVLQARSLTGAERVTIALPLAGVTAPPAPEPAAAPQLAVDEVRVAKRPPWRSWFGLPEELTVDLTLRNPGPTDVTEPVFTLLFGPAGRANMLVPAPALETIKAGQTRTYQIQVPMDVAVFGKHELHGRIDLDKHPVAFVVETTRYPWGLLGLAVFLIAIGVSRPRRTSPPRQTVNSACIERG